MEQKYYNAKWVINRYLFMYCYGVTAISMIIEPAVPAVTCMKHMHEYCILFAPALPALLLRN